MCLHSFTFFFTYKIKNALRGSILSSSSFLTASLVGSWDKDSVDGVDDTIVGGDIRRPVAGLGGSLGLEANDSVVQPVLAELAVAGQGAALHGVLVAVKAVHANLAWDDVVLEDVGGDVGSDFLGVLLEGRVRWGEDGVVTAGEVNVGILEGSSELSEVVVSLDVGFVEALSDTLGSPEDFGSLHLSDGVNDGGTVGGGSTRGEGGRCEGTGTSDKRGSKEEFHAAEGFGTQGGRASAIEGGGELGVKSKVHTRVIKRKLQTQG